MKKCIVTGAAGFTGCNLVKKTTWSDMYPMMWTNKKYIATSNVYEEIHIHLWTRSPRCCSHNVSRKKGALYSNVDTLCWLPILENRHLSILWSKTIHILLTFLWWKSTCHGGHFISSSFIVLGECDTIYALIQTARWEMSGWMIRKKLY